MSNWSIPLDKFAEKAQLALEEAAREITFRVYSNVVLMTPVGNPELWAANAHIIEKRENFPKAIAAINAALDAAGSSAKRLKTPSRRTINKKFPLVAGKGYVGGRFRANWNVTVNSPDYTTTESTSATRANEEVNKVLDALPVGGIYMLSNGLPYGYRLEYEAWSKQAPAGFIRISALRINEFVQETIKK